VRRSPPTLASKGLHEDLLHRVSEVRRATAAALGFATPIDLPMVRDRVEQGLGQLTTEAAWRERWLDLLAWSAGFQVDQEGAGRGFVAALARSPHRVVALLDGLEDMSSNPYEQRALRALLADVPEWLALQPARQLGLIVFVRRDMVEQAVRQNAAPLLARYEPYALRWDATEALRRIAWACARVGVLSDLDEDELRGANKEELGEATSSDWVLGALSGFKGQIQARDVVRFLHLAAQGSIHDSRGDDRLLTPQAMRGAILRCSSEKIREIEQENLTLRELFSQLRRLDEERRQIPLLSHRPGSES
jgi:hypothetical protein